MISGWHGNSFIIVGMKRWIKNRLSELIELLRLLISRIK